MSSSGSSSIRLQHLNALADEYILLHPLTMPFEEFAQQELARNRSARTSRLSRALDWMLTQGSFRDQFLQFIESDSAEVLSAALNSATSIGVDASPVEAASFLLRLAKDLRDRVPAEQLLLRYGSRVVTLIVFTAEKAFMDPGMASTVVTVLGKRPLDEAFAQYSIRKSVANHIAALCEIEDMIQISRSNT
jgi:hypothetical protein